MIRAVFLLRVFVPFLASIRSSLSDWVSLTHAAQWAFRGNFKSLTLFIFASLLVHVAHVHWRTILRIVYIYVCVFVLFPFTLFIYLARLFRSFHPIVVINITVFNRNRENFSMPLQCHFVDIWSVDAAISHKMCPIMLGVYVCVCYRSFIELWS